MDHKIRRPLALVALLVAAALAGCAEGDADEAGDLAQREETKTFTIPAGGSVEYKLQMAKDGKLDYTWNAPRALTYDFHGDTGGDLYTSHKKGLATTDRGSWTAPFDGRHGWWWQNNNRESVNVTLTTEGTYAVVGVV